MILNLANFQNNGLDEKQSNEIIKLSQLYFNTDQIQKLSNLPKEFIAKEKLLKAENILNSKRERH